jgi:hypothetical protein
MRIKVLLLNLGVFIAAVAATPEVKITAPPDGTIVAPGGVLMVTVDATPFAFKSVFIAGKATGFTNAVATPPYRFAIRIPPDTDSGTDTLEAVGVIEPGNLIVSASLTIDVERPDTPRSLKTELSFWTFHRGVGDDTWLSVDGVFADGSIVDLTRSRFTSYRSASPAVASVGADGHVTAKGLGSTAITIQHRDQRVVVRITVETDGAVERGK